MSDLPVDVSHIVEAYRSEHNADRALDRVLALLAKVPLGDLSRTDIWAGHEAPPPDALQDKLAEFAVYLVSCLLEDHRLSKTEQSTIAFIKRLLYIEEGALLARQRDAIVDLLRGEVCLILQDETVDPEEAIHQVDVQAALDLSYDQYLELTEEFLRPLVEEIVEPLQQDPGNVSKKEAVLAQLRLLDTVLPLDPQTFELHWGGLSGSGHGDAPGRTISQAVKDAVWRRDNGKCAQCGGNAALEFDHIVPFAKGGSNTYRNIQLLCGTCNRAKSARIG